MPPRTLRDDLSSSPITATVDKFWEAWYFLLGMCDNYHDPYAFRYELNAFIQALRNITFMLQSEKSRPPSFKDWYVFQQEKMRSDAHLRKFVEVRNFIVKKSMLATASKAHVGLFRGRRFKLGLNMELDPFQDSRALLEKTTKFMVGFMIDEAHSAIGEQAGIRRTWIVEDIGPNEVTGYCIDALSKMGKLLEEAHILWGGAFDATFEVPDPDSVFVLLESDLDLTLPTQWGWITEPTQTNNATHHA